MSIRTRTNGNRLFIHGIQPEDFGKYKCVVERYGGKKKVTKTVEIKRVDHRTSDSDKRPQVRIMAIEKDIREGGKIELECVTGK